MSQKGCLSENLRDGRSGDFLSEFHNRCFCFGGLFLVRLVMGLSREFLACLVVWKVLVFVFVDFLFDVGLLHLLVLFVCAC
jgi:hypothetical protein